MKRPVVDYRQFRLSRVNEPRFAHTKLLLGWVFYFVLYFLTENLIAPERCHPVRCFLDDITPFCEFFVVPYVLWYVLVFGSLLYYFLYDVENFKRLQKFIIVTQVVAMAVYILWPNRQDLRPEVFPARTYSPGPSPSSTALTPTPGSAPPCTWPIPSALPPHV